MQDERTDLDDAFGHWLAGFADGEGSFTINCSRFHESLHTVFKITLRIDDRPILEEIQRHTGLGKLFERPARGATNPSVSWVVTGKRDCAQLVRLFDRYPLRAKKARDYAVWREGVREWNRPNAMTRTNGQYSIGPRRDWSRLAELRRQLMEARAYSVAEPAIDGPVDESDPYPTLFAEVA